MTARSPRFGESFVRLLAVVGVAAITLTLLPATARSQDVDDPSDACPVDPPAGDFDDQDDIPDVHAGNVACAAYFEIALGFEGGEFRPGLPVRRDQMASFIARTLDAADVDLPDPSEGADFDDVDDGNPHRDAIRRLEAAGITLGGALGLPDDEFGPTLRTRRDQMTSFVIRAAERAYGEGFDDSSQRFEDVSSDNVHFENVNFAARVGIVQGFDGDTFGPDRHTRRDQMTAFVVRLLDFLTTPAEVEITEQSAETAAVGESITATATVFSQFRDDAADTASGADTATLADEEVTFSAEHAETAGAVVPPETQTVETNEDGEASFTFTSVQTGTVTVSASIVGPGGDFVHADGDADSAEKEFAGGPIGQLTLPLSWENEVGSFGDVDDPAAALPASGTVTLAYNAASGEVFTSGEVTVSSPIPDDGSPAGSNHHLHAGPLDENGDVVIPLATPQHVGGDDPATTDRGEFVYSLDGRVQDEDFGPVLEDLDRALGEAGEGELVDFYVNVHTVDNPGGEVRGQLPGGGQGQLPPVYQEAGQHTAGDPTSEMLLTFNEAVQQDPDAADLAPADFTVMVEGSAVAVTDTHVGTDGNWTDPGESHYIETDATLTGGEDVEVTIEASGQAKILAADDDQALDSEPTRSFTVPSGALDGTVTDAETEAPIESATVTATRDADGTSHETTTNVDGEYQLSFLEPGDYTVEASATGYQDATQSGVTVTEGATTTVDFALEPS